MAVLIVRRDDTFLSMTRCARPSLGEEVLRLLRDSKRYDPARLAAGDPDAVVTLARFDVTDLPQGGLLAREVGRTNIPQIGRSP